LTFAEEVARVVKEKTVKAWDWLRVKAIRV